ncbi:eukaryotic-like serine/threonine-protein kinase [Phycisphaerales bacterium]|nr:eukaryotic-like serine/threonine-protein kinase [Phycisphaerales bacterium]
MVHSLREIEDAFLRAAELSPGDREAFLRAQCNGDLQFRAQVERLLEHDRSAPDRFLAGCEPVDDEAAPGTIIGSFRIVERLGEGGFGSVYLAEQTEPLKRRVALKILKLGMDTRRIVRRFLAERQVLAMMEHPNIARAIDAGSTPRGRPYFVMEYVPGVPLTRFADRERLGVRERLEVFLSACDAVAHAHQKGIIHRDLKPANLLVESSDGRSALKVIDFGIAKVLAADAERTTSAELLRPMGTPEYMSPEQAAPGATAVDTRSDIYSLGAVLYELLTGELPRPKPPGAGAPCDTAWALPPSTRVVRADNQSAAAARRLHTRALARGLRGDLDWVTLKALAPEPDQRYGTCAELAADIRRHLAGEPVLAGRPGTWYRARKFVHRNRAVVVGAALLGLSLIGGIIATSVQAVRARQAEADAAAQTVIAQNEAQAAAAQRQLAEEQRQVAQEQTQIAEAKAAAADKANEFLTDLMNEASPGRSRYGELSLREALDRASERVGAGALTDQPEVEMRVRQTLSMTYLKLACYKQATPHFRWRIADYERKGDPHALASCLYWAADAAGSLGEIETAEAYLKRSAEIHRAEKSGYLKRTLNSLGNLYLVHKRYDEAIAVLDESRSLWPDITGKSPPVYIFTVFHLAQAYLRTDRKEEGERLYEEARVLADEHLAPGSPHALTFRSSYTSEILIPRGRRAEAVTYLTSGFNAVRESMGIMHPRVTTFAIQVARLINEEGCTEEALTLLEEARAAYRAREGSDVKSNSRLLLEIAVCRAELRSDGAYPSDDLADLDTAKYALRCRQIAQHRARNGDAQAAARLFIEAAGNN